jgi:hypothetical protein
MIVCLEMRWQRCWLFNQLSIAVSVLDRIVGMRRADFCDGLNYSDSESIAALAEAHGGNVHFIGFVIRKTRRSS